MGASKYVSLGLFMTVESVVSWGARETHPAARGPHQLTMGTVVADRSLDTSGTATAAEAVIGELC